MPQLPDRFSAYPVTVRLDGNGDGTIRFQATGKNIVITNLYVAVSTQTLQAKCTVYKNQIGSQWAINTTNSGSTGASAYGRIELLDGEAIYVVWDGGDASATATATFTGMVLPFNVTPEQGTEFVWADPIAAGDGSLIYPALQSPDFQTGVQGWRIDRDGDVEFNDGTFRGTVDVTGSVTGSGVIINGTQGQIELVPPASVNGLTVQSATMRAALLDNASTGYGYLEIVGAGVNSLSRPVITLKSETVDGEVRHTQIQGELRTDAIIQQNGSSQLDTRVAGVDTASSSTPIGVTETVVLTADDGFGNDVTFKAQRAYRAQFDGTILSSVANTDVLFRVRKTNAAGQQLNVSRRPVRLASTSYDGSFGCIFIIGSSDVAAKIALTLTGSGAHNVSIAAGAASPAEFNIYDIGPAGNYVSAPVLT